MLADNTVAAEPDLIPFLDGVESGWFGEALACVSCITSCSAVLGTSLELNLGNQSLTSPVFRIFHDCFQTGQNGVRCFFRSESRGLAAAGVSADPFPIKMPAPHFSARALEFLIRG
jgi:hypothetical protein